MFTQGNAIASRCLTETAIDIRHQSRTNKFYDAVKTLPIHINITYNCMYYIERPSIKKKV